MTCASLQDAHPFDMQPKTFVSGPLGSGSGTGYVHFECVVTSRFQNECNMSSIYCWKESIKRFLEHQEILHESTIQESYAPTGRVVSRSQHHKSWRTTRVASPQAPSSDISPAYTNLVGKRPLSLPTVMTSHGHARSCQNQKYLLGSVQSACHDRPHCKTQNKRKMRRRNPCVPVAQDRGPSG